MRGIQIDPMLRIDFIIDFVSRIVFVRRRISGKPVEPVNSQTLLQITQIRYFKRFFDSLLSCTNGDRCIGIGYRSRIFRRISAGRAIAIRIAIERLSRTRFDDGLKYRTGSSVTAKPEIHMVRIARQVHVVVHIHARCPEVL